MSDLADRVAVLTGASRGLGPGIAAALVAHGARVVPCDDDVTGVAEATAVVAEATRAFGRVDVLVSTGGPLVPKAFLDHTEADWDATMSGNLRAAFAWAQAVLPGMIEAGSGSIVHVSSIAAFHYTTRHVAYAVAQAGLVALTRDLAYEVAPHGVRVNAVAPGPVDVPMTEGVADRLDAARRTPLRIGRWGTPDDVGEAVCFLASDRAGFVTGETLSVAGATNLRVRRD